MLQRSSVIIDEKKSEDFGKFLSKNAKKKEYWEEIHSSASAPIDRKDIDALFEKKD